MAVESFIAPPQHEPPTPRGSRRSQAIYTALQREIVLGLLAPRATILEMELAQRFAVSQGTVREALLLLQEEGLVVRQAHRGTTVADCRAEDAAELLRLRHDVECRGIPRALRNADPARLVPPLEEALEEMRRAAVDGDEYLLSVWDRAFHLRLYEAADLPSVKPVLARCLVHVHRFKIRNSQRDRALMETAERHRSIVDALARGDAGRAVAAMSHHVSTIVDLGPRLIPPTAPNAEVP